MSQPDINDLLSPDAPLVALMSIQKNTLLKDMTKEQLTELLANVKRLAESPASLSGKLTQESKTRAPSAKKAAIKNILDNL